MVRSEEGVLIRSVESTPDPNRITCVPCSDSFSIIVQLRDFSSHRLWSGNKLVYDGGHAKGTMSLAYLGEEIRCQHRSSYDNVRFLLPHASIKNFLYEEGRRASSDTARIIGADDPTVYHLTMALLPSFSQRGAEVGDKLFIEQIMLALLMHIQGYFSLSPARSHVGKGLALWQLQRAKEVIAGHLAEGVTVARLAEECGLSRGYFTKAFKRSTGFSPHEWLMHLRIDKAKELMLKTDEKLSQISVFCGFVDQSHFSRVFHRQTGVSPFAWRRNRRQDSIKIESPP